MTKLLRLAWLVGLIWLSGCASPPPTASPTNPSVSPEPVGLATTIAIAKPEPGLPAPASTPPSYPSGSLSEIVPGSLSSPEVAKLAAPADLWERIRRGFAMPDLQSDLVLDREQWYAARPDYLTRMTERSRKYLFHIVEELERRSMPTELALLPFIESAFNPQAVSSAKAAGMWQFIPSTGKHYDLKQNAFRDDRRDVLASTRAALDYLQKLHGMFNDWHLALAAYNWGEGSVGRAIAKNQAAGKNTAYTDLSMPMETRFYVPKLQAVKNIVARPANFSVNLPLIDNHPFFDSVLITRDIDVAIAAKLAEVSVEDFKALNPSLNRPVILAAGMPKILLPWDNATLFQRNLEAFDGSRLSSWTVWVAPGTMKVAEAAKRSGSSESLLRQVNNIPPRMLVRAGSALLIPRADHVQKDVTEHLADNGQLSLTPEQGLRRTVRKAGKNETVSSIAKRFGISADSVAEWNKVSSNTVFRPGQSVVLYLAAPARSAHADKRGPTKTASKSKKAKSPKHSPQMAQR
ncbi:MAG: transglycosylase SLT domain-containing protein [Hylemonella sp.]